MFAPSLVSGQGKPAAPSGKPQESGQNTFRFDTFDDEQLWTNVLRMHEAIPSVSPLTALAVGLKVDVDALPPELIAALEAGQVDLTDPAITIELLRLNAVVGIMGKVDDLGQLTSVGTDVCPLSLDRRQLLHDRHRQAPRRLAEPRPECRRHSRAVSRSGRCDQGRVRHMGSGKIRSSTSCLRRPQTSHSAEQPVQLPVLIPPAYGLQGVGFETYTADGSILYWNSYVGVSQMGGQGNFSDPRIGSYHHAEAGSRHAETAGTARLSAQSRQRRFRRAGASMPPQRDAANVCSTAKLTCATCHKPPTYTDVLSGPDPSVPIPS